MKNTYSDTVFKRELKFIEIIFRYIKNKYSSKNLNVYIEGKNSDFYPLIIIKEKGIWKNKKTLKIHIYEQWKTISFLNYFYIPTIGSLHKRTLIISRDKNILLEKLIYSCEDYYEYEIKHITSNSVRINEIFLNCKIFSIIDLEITKFLNEGNENKRFFDFFNFSLFSKRMDKIKTLFKCDNI